MPVLRVYLRSRASIHASLQVTPLVLGSNSIPLTLPSSPGLEHSRIRDRRSFWNQIKQSKSQLMREHLQHLHGGPGSDRVRAPREELKLGTGFFSVGLHLQLF